MTIYKRNIYFYFINVFNKHLEQKIQASQNSRVKVTYSKQTVDSYKCNCLYNVGIHDTYYSAILLHIITRNVFHNIFCISVVIIIITGKFYER